jgi:calcium-dependent protein kinase
MEDNASSKENVCELYINENNIIDKYKKERILSNKSLTNKEDFLVIKNNSHINKNNNNKTFINTIMIKPNNKSEIYKIKSNLMKFYNDVNGAKKLVINIPKILTKTSSQPEEEKTKENIVGLNNNYSNMPSYTKMLRKALYSTSDISSMHSNSNSNGGNNSSSIGNSGHSLTHKNSSDSTQVLEQISEEEHMHEDNQTLLQVIIEKRNNQNLNSEDNKDKVNCKICVGESDKNENNSKKGSIINSYFNNDLIVMISTTKREVEKIQSKIETAKKINQSYSCNECTKRININKPQDNILSFKEKNKKFLIDDNDKVIDKSSNNPHKIIEKKNLENNNETSLINLNQNSLNIPIIMIASSLMKDIRDIYKFKEKPLGGGNFGTVRKAYRREEKSKKKHYYAIKSISKNNLNEKDFEGLVKEVDIISSLDHPNIIKFYETYHDKFYFHLVMELCKGRDSFNQIVMIEKCEEKKVVSLIAKVLLAIAHCHSRGITHRDLKPENILFENNSPDAEIKIIDFGLSRKYAKDEKMHSVLGTPFYVAPEVLKGNYNEKCDVWSIGAMTYLLLCGQYPFNGNSDKEIFDNILHSNIKFNSFIWNNISSNAKSFVKLCLEKNPDKRPSAVKALDHPWFTNVLNETHRVENLRAGILLNIKNFKIKQKFKQMIMKYLLNTMEEDELKIYKSAFFAIDFFHNGCVEQPELKKAFELKNIPITDEEISHLYKILDQNLKGAMDYTEFLMAGVNQKNLFTTEKLTKAFNYFDINRSGFIENSDLYDSLLRMGRECINTNDINSFIYEVLKNIDNNKKLDKNLEFFTKVSYDDFLKIFQNDKTNNFSP